MPIRLKWVDRNTGTEGTRIYRSDTPMDPLALPAPLATVAPGVTEYVDDTALRDRLYYYRFGVFKGSDMALSPDRAIAAMPYTGPGPQVPLRGDFACGYFGRLTAGDMFTASDLKALTGLTVGTVLVEDPIWMKFAYKGKILFCPSTSLLHSISWEHLYQAGLVYGTGDNGFAPMPADKPVKQEKIVQRGEHFFSVRLLKGTINQTTHTTVILGSEWNDLMFPSAMDVYPSQDKPNWDDLVYPQLGGSNGYNCWVQDTYGTTLRKTRGSSSTYDSVDHNVGGASAGTNYGWLPCLELII